MFRVLCCTDNSIQERLAWEIRMLLALFANHSLHQLETQHPISTNHAHLHRLPSGHLNQPAQILMGLFMFFRFPNMEHIFMFFAISFASVALQAFMDTGMLNPIHKNSLFWGGNLTYKSFIFFKKILSHYFSLFFIFTCRWNDSLPCIKLLLKYFLGEKSQLVD